jgi:hypothetical protein
MLRFEREEAMRKARNCQILRDNPGMPALKVKQWQEALTSLVRDARSQNWGIVRDQRRQVIPESEFTL